jgi:hypothetical protein
MNRLQDQDCPQQLHPHLRESFAIGGEDATVGGPDGSLIGYFYPTPKKQIKLKVDLQQKTGQKFKQHYEIAYHVNSMVKGDSMQNVPVGPTSLPIIPQRRQPGFNVFKQVEF